MSNEDLQNVTVPLPDFVSEIAREAARTILREHVETCPIGETVVRVTKIESRLSLLVGIMLGSGALGGVVGGTIARFFAG
jgi:hypothetical protein